MEQLGTSKWMAAALAGMVLVLGACGDDGNKDGPGDPDGAVGAADAMSQQPADAASDPVDADPASPDAAMLARDESITCGDEVCERASQVCCFTGFPNITQRCESIGACSDLPAVCDGPEDCDTGEVCCGGFEGASCVPAAQCSGGVNAELCHEDEDCTDPADQCHDSDFVAWPIC